MTETPWRCTHCPDQSADPGRDGWQVVSVQDWFGGFREAAVTCPRCAGPLAKNPVADVLSAMRSAVSIEAIEPDEEDFEEPHFEDEEASPIPDDMRGAPEGLCFEQKVLLVARRHRVAADDLALAVGLSREDLAGFGGRGL